MICNMIPVTETAVVHSVGYVACATGRLTALFVGIFFFNSFSWTQFEVERREEAWGGSGLRIGV